MMGTRSGAVDPGILIYLMRQGQLDAQQLDQVLNQKSGLLGISGLSSDMREILAAIQQGHERAKLAFEIFVHRLRSAACSTLEFLGITLDSEVNARPSLDADISSADSRVRVLVIRAEEDWAIATECWKLTQAPSQVGAAG